MNTTQKFNGMNGTILLDTGRDELNVGTVPGDDYGYPGFQMPVTVSVRIERAERSETYETTSWPGCSRCSPAPSGT